ncbi:MAG: hypothetical protein JWO67_1795 [Streptosporangiaceae bacterium]|nr:hypothetical protein [Streptosporangiaceae bacterium]
MRNWMKNAGRVALVGAGFFAIGSGVASADVTDGSGGVLSGNQVEAPVSVPINVSGNALSALGGMAIAQGPGRSQVSAHSRTMGANDESGSITSGRRGILSGNQVKAPISVPINACGNAIALSSVSKAACGDGGSAMVAAPEEQQPQQQPQQQHCGGSMTSTKTWSKSTCTWTAPAPAPVQAPAPATACEQAAPTTTVTKCESSTSESAVRTLPAENPFAVTSMVIPTRKQRAAAQEVTTYEKMTNVRQAAGSVVDGKAYIASPTSAMEH